MIQENEVKPYGYYLNERPRPDLDTVERPERGDDFVIEYSDGRKILTKKGWEDIKRRGTQPLVWHDMMKPGIKTVCPKCNDNWSDYGVCPKCGGYRRPAMNHGQRPLADTNWNWD